MPEAGRTKPTERKDVEDWRRRFSDRQFVRIFWFFVVIVGYFAAHEWNSGQLLTAPLAMLCLPPMFVAAFVRQLGPRTRAILLMASLQVAGIVDRSQSGVPLANSFVFISAMITVFALICGRRFALISVLSYTALLIGCGIVQSFYPPIVPRPLTDVSSMLNWLRVSAIFGGIGLLTVGAISAMIENTEAAVDRNAMLIGDLQAETEKKAIALQAQRLLQLQLHQAAELESLGRLAAGVAHDFNNLLVVIINNASMLAETRPSKDLLAIENAGQQAARLCRQLLTMGKERVVPSQRLLLGNAIDESLELVRRLLPSNILVDVHHDQDTGWINASEAEIEQVILNLCINARDAMLDGGKLRISTHRVHRSIFGNSEKRQFACLRVEDTGHGMDEQTRRRITEPFLTSKPREEGTGLGLAVVLGALKQHNGFLEVQSSLGNGSRFEAYFPGTS